MTDPAGASVQAVPEHLGTVTPRLMVRDGGAAIDFYRQAFGAEALGEIHREGTVTITRRLA